MPLGSVIKRATRFPGGLNTSTPTQAMRAIGMLDPSAYHYYFTDFNVYAAGDWTVTKIGTGTQALTAGDGGLLLNTNSAGATDSISNQLTVASFAPVAGKRAFFKTRFKLSDVTASQFIIGLVNATTTPLTNTDGIFFQKPAATALVDVYVELDATTGRKTSAGVITLVADTFIELAWAYNGHDSVSFFANDVLITKLDASATYLPNANLAVTFLYANTTAVANTMTLDYIFAARER